MTNLGLKLKVFFLMAVVITALSAANFLLFRDFLVKIDVQDGAKNIAKSVETELKNRNYSLISNSFEMAKELKIEKGKVVNSKENLVASVKAFLEAQEELDEKSLATLFYGEGVSEEEKEEIQGLLEEAIPFLDVVSFDIERKLYDLAKADLANIAFCIPI